MMGVGGGGQEAGLRGCQVPQRRGSLLALTRTAQPSASLPAPPAPFFMQPFTPHLFIKGFLYARPSAGI